MSRTKFVSTLNIALHPTTGEAEALAAIRGAYRLLNGKSVEEFLTETHPLRSDSELATKLHLAEQKLASAVECCNTLKVQIDNLQQQLSDAKALSRNGVKRWFAVIGRHPVMTFWAASLAIGFIATQGNNRPIVTIRSPDANVEKHTSGEPYSVVGGWNIQYNSRGKFCYMGKFYPGDTELVFGYNGTEYAMLLRTKNNLVGGNNYVFNVQFRTSRSLLGSPNVKTTLCPSSPRIAFTILD